MEEGHIDVDCTTHGPLSEPDGFSRKFMRTGKASVVPMRTRKEKKVSRDLR